LSILYNYFDNYGPIKLFPDLHLAKFLDTSVKPFFLCIKLLIIRHKIPPDNRPCQNVISLILRYTYNIDRYLFIKSHLL